MNRSFFFSILMSLVLSFSAYADSSADKSSYENFEVGGESFIFSDFKTADYTILYDIDLKKAFYKAQITFDLSEDGFALFDVVTMPLKISLNGSEINAKKVRYKSLKAMYLNKSLAAGSHTVEFIGEIQELVDFSVNGRVRSAFWFTDLDDRNFLERFMPSSFEYDRVKMNFRVKIKGATTAHKLMVNGELTEMGENEFNVDFPSFYNASSLYFHLVPEDKINLRESTLTSVDGRELPVRIYYTLTPSQKSLNEEESLMSDYMKAAKDSIRDLENRFGAFLHDQMIIYASDGGGHSNLGGMEYCGATITNRGALNHEIIHSYFGRGIIPANGNAGWIDEAITTWAASQKYNNLKPRYFKNPQNLYGRSSYIRITNTGAYSQGMRFMGGLAGYLELKGELPFTDFLAEIIKNNKYVPYTNQDFWNWSEDFYGTSFIDLLRNFNTPFSLFSSLDNALAVIPYAPEENKVHKKVSLEQLRALL